jgi:hypothetical protein
LEEAFSKSAISLLAFGFWLLAFKILARIRVVSAHIEFI